MRHAELHVAVLSRLALVLLHVSQDLLLTLNTRIQTLVRVDPVVDMYSSRWTIGSVMLLRM